jgi:hypothetical protein
MINLKRKVLALAMLSIVSAGAFAQKPDDRRPPKNPDKVVERPKGERPPRENNNQDKKGGDQGKKGRP